jgi:hypothetical protein
MHGDLTELTIYIDFFQMAGLKDPFVASVIM